MIEPFEQRLERGFEVGEIHDPAELGIERSLHVHLDAERMPMQARAFVPGRNVRQAVRGFDLERLRDIHAVILSGKRAAA